MDNIVHIRKATDEDCTAIAALGKKTFTETYSETGNNAVVQEYIEKKLSAENIREELDDPRACFYIGFVNDEPVAFARLRYDRIAKGLTGRKAIEIEHLYVLKAYQGFKVGKEMMEKCKQAAIRKKFDTIWLRVWQQNHRAIRFYLTAGFVVYETEQFSYGSNMPQDDFLMRLDLYY
jgi:ribosomal protein S18 acetylase RimI-like enzyme